MHYVLSVTTEGRKDNPTFALHLRLLVIPYGLYVSRNKRKGFHIRSLSRLSRKLHCFHAFFIPYSNSSNEMWENVLSTLPRLHPSTQQPHNATPQRQKRFGLITIQPSSIHMCNSCICAQQYTLSIMYREENFQRQLSHVQTENKTFSPFVALTLYSISSTRRTILFTFPLFYPLKSFTRHPGEG